MPNNDKFKDYTRYAEHCLNMVAGTTDQELRRVQREMAAEWLRLADEIRRPHKSWLIPPLKSGTRKSTDGTNARHNEGPQPDGAGA